MHCNLFADDINSRWIKLLHFGKHKALDNTSEYFFLSNSKQPKDEYNEFIKQVTGFNRKDIICNFPARYKFIQQQDKTFPTYDLSKCHELQKFVSSFQNKYLSVVMSSEYLNAPSSAFGHIMIVLHDDLVPDFNSDLIQFTAETNKKDSFLTYLRKGIFGGYVGYYRRTAFFEKIDEYLNKEQRYMFIYTLNSTKEQRLFLIYHLYELRKSKFNYYFFNNNCANQIDNLLEITLDTPVLNNLLYTLPIEVVEKKKDKITNRSKLIPLVSSAKQLINKLGKKDLSIFNNIIQGKLILNKGHSDVLTQTVYSYYLFQFKKNNIVLPNYTKNIQMKFKVLPLKKDNISSPLLKQKKSRLTIGQGVQKGSPANYQVTIRPLLISEDDFQKHSIHESELSILETNLIYSKSSIRLNELKFINAKLLDQKNQYFGGISWQVYSGLNRFNDENYLQFENLFAIGHSFCKFSCFNYMIAASFALGPQMNKLHLKPEISFYGYFFNKFKYNFKIKYVLAPNFNNLVYSSYLNYFYTRTNSFGIEYKKNERLNPEYLFKMSVYF